MTGLVWSHDGMHFFCCPSAGFSPHSRRAPSDGNDPQRRNEVSSILIIPHTTLYFRLLHAQLTSTRTLTFRYRSIAVSHCNSNQIRTNPALATTTIPLTKYSYSKLHKAASAIDNTTTRLSTH
jgi:hypothetical protein